MSDGEMSVQFRIQATGNGCNLVIVRNGVEETRRFKNERRARTAMEHRRNILAGNVDLEELTLREFFETWLHDYVESECSADTLYRYRLDLGLVVPDWGGLLVIELGSEGVRAILATVAENGASFRRGMDVVRTLSSCMSEAVDWGYRRDNPFRGVLPPLPH
jgi:hypothetical protein